jgi:CBS domain-containing protein
MAPDDFLFNALLRMTRHNINRLVIRDGPAIHGILEQIDLLSYLSNHSHLIALQIERAQSKEELQWASRELVNVIRDLHAKGIKIRYIMQLVSELNKKMLRNCSSCWHRRSCWIILPAGAGQRGPRGAGAQNRPG